MGVTMAEQKKIATEFAPCRKAGKGEKSRILDEYLALSGGKSRKYALFKLNMKQVGCERVGAKKKRTCDEAKTPFQRLLEQPFEDGLEERRVKIAALALKETVVLAAQKQKMDQAVDSLLNCVQDVPVIPRCGTARYG
jgi:hypothetical protein